MLLTLKVYGGGPLGGFLLPFPGNMPGGKGVHDNFVNSVSR